MPRSRKLPHSESRVPTTPATGEAAKSSKSGLAAMLRIVDPASFVLPNFKLMQDLLEIAVGKSALAPDQKDSRFKHKAWSESGLYRRVAQTYLATTGAIERSIAKDLAPDERARAELVTSILTSALAPTNTLLGNPAALERTLETRGANLKRGARNLLKDLRENGGMPAQVDASPFEVGVNLAVTPGKVVLRTEMFELIHYKPATASVHEIPVLLIPPQIGRYYFTDLAPGRSFAEYVVASGLQYFAVVWRNPTAEHRDWGLENYLDSALQAVETVNAIAGEKGVNLVGFCAGGILSTMLASYLEAKGDSPINSLTLCVTMLDFSADTTIGAFRVPVMLEKARAKSQAKGILRGEDLNKVFTWLRPNDLVWNYWVNNYLMGDDPPAFDILAWNQDSTNLPARLHEDFLALFSGNPLAIGKDFSLMGEAIDVSSIRCDSFLVGAINDHITPWKACFKSCEMVGGESTFALSNGGHIAALVNPPDNPKAFHWLGAGQGDDPDAWLEGADKQPGSWWVGWARWCSGRAGAQVASPKRLGSRSFKPVGDAPGTYVREASDRA